MRCMPSRLLVQVRVWTLALTSAFVRWPRSEAEARFAFGTMNAASRAMQNVALCRNSCLLSAAYAQGAGPRPLQYLARLAGNGQETGTCCGAQHAQRCVQPQACAQARCEYVQLLLVLPLVLLLLWR